MLVSIHVNDVLPDKTAFPGTATMLSWTVWLEPLVL